jgi:hypothetical protein
VGGLDGVTHAGFFIERQRSGLGGGFVADISHAIDAGLRFAAADGEVHRAVLRMDDDIGERQRLAEDELLLHGLVAGAFAFEVDGPHGAVGPIVDVDGVLVFRGEFRAGASDDAGGAAGADVERGGQRVGVVVRPFAAAAAPAVVGTADAVIHAGGAIPGAADVPLHVGVVGEELAVGR